MKNTHTMVKIVLFRCLMTVMPRGAYEIVFKTNPTDQLDVGRMSISDIRPIR